MTRTRPRSPRTRAFAPARLADLLGAGRTASFLDEHFDKKPLHLRGHLQRFLPLFGRTEFFSIVRHESTAEFHGTFPDGDGIFEATRRSSAVRINGRAVPAMIAAGATIALRHVERHDRRVAELVAGIRHDLAWTGNVYCSSFLSENGLGVPPHMDANASFILQLEGTKRWRISRCAALPWPRLFALQLGDGTIVFPDSDGAEIDVSTWERQLEPMSDSECTEVTLAPGDVLYLPAGTWHATRATSAAPSLSLNLHLDPLPVLDLLIDMLRPLVHEHVTWRRIPAQRRAAGEGIPASLESYFHERIAELRAALDTLDSGLPGLEEAWKHRISAARAPGAESRARDSAAPARASIDRLRLAPTVTFVVTRDATGRVRRVRFFRGERAITIDAPKVLPLAERLAREGTLLLGRRSGRLRAKERNAVLMELVRAGVLEPELVR